MDRKTAIIDSATRLFAEKGVSETSTGEIAEIAGVAQGTLFYHFKNKQGIISEIFSRAGSDYLDEFRKTLDSSDTGIKKIEAAIRFNKDYSRHHSQLMLIFLRMFPDLKDRQAPEREILETIREQVIEMIKNSLAAGIEDGTIKCGNIEETAWVINSLIFGIAHMNLMAAEKMPELTGNASKFCRRALRP